MRPKTTIDDYDDEENEFDKEAHQKFQAPTDWDGPIEKRHCTDTLCLMLLGAALFIFTSLGYYASRAGDARLLVYPMDYDGNICGLDFQGKDMTEYPYLYYVNSFMGGVCIDECPTSGVDIQTLITYNGTWQLGNASLPDDFLQVADYSDAEGMMACTEDLCFPNGDAELSWTSTGINRGLGFAYYVGDTYEIFKRCYLTTESQVEIAQFTDSLSERKIDFINPLESHAFWTNFYGDLWTARFLILGFGFGVSLLLSLMYVILLRMPFLLKIVIWASIGCVVGTFAIAGYYTNSLAKKWASEDPLTSVRHEQIKYTEFASYGLYFLSAVFLIFACCFRQSIHTAVRCVREAGRAINRMVLLFGVPCLQGVVLLAFWTLWGYCSAHLASLGEITTRSFDLGFQGTQVSVRVFEFNDFTKYSGWYFLFVFFWVAAFILATGDMTVALAVSRWYFTRDKRRVNSYWVPWSLGTILRYHLGTLAFGSLLMAIVRLLRFILMRIQQAVASMTNKKIADMLLCCCQCCLCCVERILKFFNKNAYIQCAIFGTPFLESGRKSFFLILRNAGRVGAVAYVSGAVLFTGKLLISTLTTVLSYYTVVEYKDYVLRETEDLYSYGGPMLLVFCISYFVGSMFMSVFGTSILTILHCVAADEEMFDGDSRYSDKNFQRWLDQQENKENEK